MNNQIEIIFKTSSPINKSKLNGQNLRLLNWLRNGNTIHLYHPAKKELGIGYLNSRISDCRNKGGAIIFDRMIEVNGTWCKEYSMKEFL